MRGTHTSTCACEKYPGALGSGVCQRRATYESGVVMLSPTHCARARRKLAPPRRTHARAPLVGARGYPDKSAHHTATRIHAPPKRSPPHASAHLTARQGAAAGAAGTIHTERPARVACPRTHAVRAHRGRRACPQAARVRSCLHRVRTRAPCPGKHVALHAPQLCGSLATLVSHAAVVHDAQPAMHVQAPLTALHVPWPSLRAPPRDQPPPPHTHIHTHVTPPPHVCDQANTRASAPDVRRPAGAHAVARGAPVPGVACALLIDAGTVPAALRRARARLRKRLDDHEHAALERVHARVARDVVLAPIVVPVPLGAATSKHTGGRVASKRWGGGEVGGSMHVVFVPRRRRTCPSVSTNITELPATSTNPHGGVG